MPRLRTYLLFCSLVLTACASSELENSNLRRLTILYTNDEHGWMEGMEAGQSAAHLYEMWQQEEGYYEDGPFLILSGGDNWTGPAISTWTEGESMVDVMNAMHYDASAVGNHEFDFGLEVIKARSVEADYPYLSANTRWRSSGESPTDIGILPFTVTTVNELRVGIIGLTTLDTPTATNPINVQDLDFIDYEVALRETLPLVQAQDTDINLVIAHICVEPLERLIRNTRDLDIALFGAGHCNELLARRVHDAVLLSGGFHFTAYAKANFTVDTESNVISQRMFTIHDNEYATESETIAGIVRSWSAETEEILSEELAYSERVFERRGEELEQAIVNSWLLADPRADIAITNAGGIRIDLPEGIIDVGTVMALMPFDNTIIATELDGATVRTVVETGTRPVIGGLLRRSNRWVLSANGEELDDDRTYRVLVNSFMYAGGDGYTIIPETDPDGFDTGINYRQPFQDWLEAQESSEQNPLRLD
jgi:5'-nucleotidase/UDP-sugar diphosphatase